MDLADLEQQAKEILKSVENYPEKRLALRQEFYRKYGYGKLTEFGYGNSEIAFLEWEIRRGVLNPLDYPTQKGSAWWRGVNGDFIYFSTLAALIYESGQTFELLSPILTFWLDYIQQPSQANWYRAHNGSIAYGYKNQLETIAEENYFEKIFINMVLYRVLFAGALATGREFGKLGKILSDPRLPSVDIIVQIPDFYPDNYPLSQTDIINILHKGLDLADIGAKILDQIIILPQLAELYQFSADWLRVPQISQWCIGGSPAYPYRLGEMTWWLQLWKWVKKILGLTVK
ncbi:hypothetical protein [Thermoflexibacter ruber]|uniref:Uncharacterized protein n=1 Tax=Thermoflexibacter ruber TaxID=1003 RepID=A0A1I2JG53_9BACT|nr:hypothetical protein [Thermoflexibacter ruber]SFF52137.1 hypothetical protein SAMN04488541_10476 [Thermoflexibacter ruber]